MEVLLRKYPNRDTSRNGDIPWPALSPDITACDLFVWGFLNGKVYALRPNSVTVLKQRIEEEIQNIADGIMHKVMADVSDIVFNSVQKLNSKSVYSNCFCAYIMHVEW
jgi:hypothetical protein